MRLLTGQYRALVLRLCRIDGGDFAEVLADADAAAGRLPIAAQLAVQQREQQLAIIDPALHAICWEVDLASGTMSLSREFVERLGYEASFRTLDDDAFAALMHPDDVPAEREMRRRHRESGERYVADYRLRNAEGVYSWFRATAATSFDVDGVALSLSGTMLALHTDIRQTTSAEDGATIARLTRELRQSSSKLINAQENERRHIARELHDQTGQTLTAALLDLEFWRNKGVPAEEVEHVMGQVKLALSEIRGIALHLRPALLDEAGLETALKVYLDRQAIAAKFDVSFSTEGKSGRLSPELEITAFRLVQEAVTNIIRHAGARHVDVMLRIGRSEIVIRVGDNGSGCVTEEALNNATSGMSLGLLSMKERAALVGGRCEFISAPGVGSIVLARLPTAWKPPDAAAA
jgi:signal transduction histidine kinase